MMQAKPALKVSQRLVPGYMMEIPLQVEKDDEGIFRDALDRPMIMVFNSAKEHTKKSQKPCPEPQVTKPPLMFVQVDGSKKENRLERTKMRTHVMQNHFRKKKARKTPLEKRPLDVESGKESIQVSAVASNDRIEICAPSFQPTAGLDPIAPYPIKLGLRGYLLAHHYVTILVDWAVPTGFGWADCFRAGLEDPALFHVVLLCSAVHLQFVNNHFDSGEVAYHKLKAIQSVNDSLRQSSPKVSDHIIHAVMLLALNEGVGGNPSAANAHLDGLVRMVDIRGGLKNLDPALQQKICFMDYICCVQPDESPRFRFSVPSKSSNVDTAAKSNTNVPIGFRNILPVVALDQEFLDIIVDVEDFCVLFRRAQPSDLGNKLEPQDYDVTALRYRLVCMENARKSTSHKELVGDACRVGTMLFFKTVYDHFGCWGPSHRIWALPNKVLSEKLKAYLIRLDDSTDAARTEFLELLLWLSFMAGLIPNEAPNQRWYNSHIATTATKLGLTHFYDVRKVLERFLWIGWVHERSCRELWEDCQAESELARSASPGLLPEPSELEESPKAYMSRSDTLNMSFLSFGKSFLVRL